MCAVETVLCTACGAGSLIHPRKVRQYTLILTQALIEDAVPLLAKTQAAAKHATLSSTPYSSLSVKSHKDMEGESKPQPFFTRKRQRDETSKQPTDGTFNLMIDIVFELLACMGSTRSVRYMWC